MLREVLISASSPLSKCFNSNSTIAYKFNVNYSNKPDEIGAMKELTNNQPSQKHENRQTEV